VSASNPLEVKNVTMRFGGLKALSEFNLVMAPGELVGLIGPNGAGKTTAFNAITGVYQPSEGDVVLNGERVNGQKPHQICAKGVARTFQNIRLFKQLTALDNVRIACHARCSAGFLDALYQTAHHEDEEEDLLPRMMAAATISRGSRLTRMVADIATEHREMDRIWTELRAALQEISAGENLPLNVLSVDRFVKLYFSHIMIEETNVYPLAEMLLSRDDLEQIGAGMAERRGVTPK